MSRVRSQCACNDGFRIFGSLDVAADSCATATGPALVPRIETDVAPEANLMPEAVRGSARQESSARMAARHSERHRSDRIALHLERAELETDDHGVRRELTAIYIGRGLDPALAAQVAEQLMAHDALGAHARDELGISDTLSARPIQAAVTSAASFAVGAAMPLLAVAAVSESILIPVVSGTSLVFLAILGGLAARVGGSSVTAGAMRVTFWGALAMALTAGVGPLFGTVA